MSIKANTAVGIKAGTEQGFCFLMTNFNGSLNAKLLYDEFNNIGPVFSGSAFSDNPNTEMECRKSDQ
jgi:hypothetical protein